MGGIQQVHAEISGIIDLQLAVGFAVIGGYVRENIKSSLWLETSDTRDFPDKLQGFFSSPGKLSHHFERRSKIRSQSDHSSLLGYGICTTGKLSLQFFAGF